MMTGIYLFNTSSTDLEWNESCSVSLDRLRDVPIYGVELHGSDYATLLRGDTHEEQPLHSFVRPVVYYLTSFQRAVSVEHFLR